FLRVALRIDGNEIGFDITGFRTKLLEVAVKLVERGRAYVGAMGEAEENGRRRGAQVFFGKGLAIHGDQRERPAERLVCGLTVTDEIEAGSANDHDNEGNDEDGQELFHVRSTLYFTLHVIA